MGDVLRFFHPVLASSRLRRGPTRVLVDGRPIALFRDASGRVGALHDRCPHRFAPLSRGRVRPDGRLACPYHGWHFDADGRGASPSQPGLGRCDAPALRVIERHDTIWVAERGATDDAFPGPEAPADHRYAGRFSTLFQAPLHVALDNFSEDEHTPWVHTRLGWSEPDTGTIAYEATNFADRTEVRYTARQRETALRGLVALRRGDLFHNDWTTRFDPVRTLYSIYWTDPASGARRPASIHAAIYMVPETPRTTRFHVLLFTRFLGPFARAAPLLSRLAVGLVWLEVRDDARFIPVVADTPLDLRGMRLGRFDKPIVHNRRLLRRIYRGEPDGDDTSGAPLADGEPDAQRESVTDSP